jgi:hypothetical protein
MSKSTTENPIEQYNLQLLQALGYSYKNGYDIQPEKPPQKNGEFTMNLSPERLKQQQNLSDSEIDTSEIPELDETFWQNARKVNRLHLATAIQQRFAEVGGVELPEIPREPIRNPPTF